MYLTFYSTNDNFSSILNYKTEHVKLMQGFTIGFVALFPVKVVRVRIDRYGSLSQMSMQPWSRELVLKRKQFYGDQLEFFTNADLSIFLPVLAGTF